MDRTQFRQARMISLGLEWDENASANCDGSVRTNAYGPGTEVKITFFVSPIWIGDDSHISAQPLQIFIRVINIKDDTRVSLGYFGSVGRK
jgi:hypothetical protein